MLPYKSFISWKIGSITIQSWGLLVSIGILLGTFLAIREAKKLNIDTKHIYALIFYIVISSILGSRFVYILENWNYFSSNLLEVFLIWKGGLTLFGGFILSVISFYLYTKKHNLDFWKYSDLLTPPITLALILGRIGCILGDGGHVGKKTNFFLGVLIKNEVRHLTALYSLFALILIFILIYYLKQKHLRQGILFPTFTLSYSVSRFVIDLFRLDKLYFYFTPTQYFCIILFFISIYIIYRNNLKR